MRNTHGLLSAFVVSMICMHEAVAQDYPSKPIRLMTTSAGGGSDVVSRIIAGEMGQAMGTPIVVENQSNPTLLAMSVAKAAPDGYTVLNWGPGLWIGPLLNELPYDTARDFTPIVTLTRSPNLLIISAAMPVRTVADLIAYAKSRPGQLNYAAGANGSSGHIASELFKAMTGTDIVKVSYKGGSTAAINDMVAGQVHMNFSGGGPAFTSQLKAGKLRVLASGAAQRSSLFPEYPTIAETLPGFVSDSLLGVLAPAKTPQAIIQKLNQEANRALAKPDLRARLINAEQEAAGGTPAEFGAAINAEVERVKSIAKSIAS